MQKINTLIFAGAATVTSVMLLPGLPRAQEASSEQDNSASAVHISTLRACQAEQDPTLRLSCYDRAVGAVLQSEDSGEIQLVDKEAIKKTRRRLFGFTLPDLGLFGEKDKRSEEDRELEILQSTITSVRYVRNSTVIFTIEEGDAVWQISKAPMRLARVKAGDSVEFKKAALGSYFIRINGQIGVKGKRIR